MARVVVPDREYSVCRRRQQQRDVVEGDSGRHVATTCVLTRNYKTRRRLCNTCTFVHVGAAVLPGFFFRLHNNNKDVWEMMNESLVCWFCLSCCVLFVFFAFVLFVFFAFVFFSLSCARIVFLASRSLMAAPPAAHRHPCPPQSAHRARGHAKSAR